MDSTAIRRILDQAADQVAHLPADLRPVAFKEVLRLLAGTQAPSGSAVDGPGKPDPIDLPTASTVKQRGSRLQKAIYAASSLATAGKSPTAPAIGLFLKERLASPVSKLQDVLKSGVPAYFEREKDTDERLFVYRPTSDGIKLLLELRTPESRQ